jgi:amidase
LGTAINRCGLDRIVGGSSSGSASAVAAGLVDMAIGSDAGSIRLPAAAAGGGVQARLWADAARARIRRSARWIAPALARSVAMVEKAMQDAARSLAAAGARARLARWQEAQVQQAFDQALAGVAADVQGAACLRWRPPGASPVIMGAENWAALGTYADHPGMGEDVRAAESGRRADRRGIGRGRGGAPR